jgi:hypothetical protein
MISTMRAHRRPSTPKWMCRRYPEVLGRRDLNLRKIANALNENATASQSWRFVALEIRVMSAKKEALQALSIPQNVVWNPFTFRAKEIDESVDRGGDTLVNQRIRLRQFDVAFCCRPKCLKLLDGIFPLI